MDEALSIGADDQTHATSVRGIAAGAVACAIALPATPAALLASMLLKRTLYQKVMHSSVSNDELQLHGRESLIANTIVAGATGLIAACIATWVALTIVKRARQIAFLATAAIGITLMTIITWRIATHAGDRYGAITLCIGLAWIMGLCGLYLAERTISTPDHHSK